jgi:hypothetical protein
MRWKKREPREKTRTLENQKPRVRHPKPFSLNLWTSGRERGLIAIDALEERESQERTRTLEKPKAKGAAPKAS